MAVSVSPAKDDADPVRKGPAPAGPPDSDRNNPNSDVGPLLSAASMSATLGSGTSSGKGPNNSRYRPSGDGSGDRTARRQLLAEQADRVLVRCRPAQLKTQKPQPAQTVPDEKRRPFVTQVMLRRQDQDLEHRNNIVRRTATLRAVGISQSRVEVSESGEAGREAEGCFAHGVGARIFGASRPPAGRSQSIDVTVQVRQVGIEGSASAPAQEEADRAGRAPTDSPVRGFGNRVFFDDPERRVFLEPGHDTTALGVQVHTPRAIKVAKIKDMGDRRFDGATPRRHLLYQNV